VIGLGEHIEGVWRGDTTMHFEYVGLGDKEWSWQDDTWEERVRGEQSDFFAQMTRVLAFDTFEYRGFENGYVYDFKATVPFLSPGGWKAIRGILRISQETFLPASCSAHCLQSQGLSYLPSARTSPTISTNCCTISLSSFPSLTSCRRISIASCLPMALRKGRSLVKAS